MKKIKYIILILFAVFLCSCDRNYKTIKTSFNNDSLDNVYSSMYIPIPIKNNSVFIGWEIIGDFNLDYAVTKKGYGYVGIEIIDLEENDKLIFPSLNFDILKEFSKGNILSIKAIYHELSVEELFIFESKDSLTYGIKANKLDNYPREITIPSNYNGKVVDDIVPLAFNSIEDLVIVNLPNTIKLIDRYAFAYTSIFKINLEGIIVDSSAFSSTLLDSNYNQDNKFEFINEDFNREVKINDLIFNIDIDLNGGKIIKDEFNLILSRPIAENKIFLNYTNEEGYKLKFEDNFIYKFSLKDYYKKGVGTTFKANYIDVDDSIYNFKYLSESDSYALYFLKNDLNVSKLILPDEYNNKPITEIRDFNNKYVVDVKIGKYVKKINGLFVTPNLRKIEFNNILEYIHPYAFSSTLLTKVDLPKTINSLNEGIFLFTLIKTFTITNNIKYIDGSAFSRNKEIKYFIDNNSRFTVVNNNVLSSDLKVLFLSPYNNENKEIEYNNIEVIGRGALSYQSLYKIKFDDKLNIISDYAFYQARIYDADGIDVDNVSQSAFYKAVIKNKKMIY